MDIKEIVEKAILQDQQAIAILYELSCKKAIFLATRILCTAKENHSAEAEDIVQEAYIRAFRNLSSLKEPEKFQGWLNTIVVNSCKDYLKKNKPLLFSSMNKDDEEKKEELFEEERVEFSPEKSIDYEETKRLIQEMIDELPDAQSLAIKLKYIEDMSVLEIAKIMEVSEGTVKSYLNYGRKKLKEKVLELEKKGTKLYCFPLIPFLYFLFKQEISEFTVPSEFVNANFVNKNTSFNVKKEEVEKIIESLKQIEEVPKVNMGIHAVEPAIKTLSGIGLKLKVASVVLGLGTVAVGGVATAKFIEKRNEVKVSANHYEEKSEIEKEVEELINKEIILSDEELQLMKELYFYIDNGTQEEYMEYVAKYHNEIKSLYLDKLEKRNVLFTGEKFEETDTGRGVYIKDEATVYVGDLENGKPNGIGSLARLNRHRVEFRNVEFSKDFFYTKTVRVLYVGSYKGGWLDAKAHGEGVEQRRPYIEYSDLTKEALDIFTSDEWELRRHTSGERKESSFYEDKFDGDVKLEYLNLDRKYDTESIREYTVDKGHIVFKDGYKVNETRKGKRYVDEKGHSYNPDRLYIMQHRWETEANNYINEDKNLLFEDSGYVDDDTGKIEYQIFNEFSKFKKALINYLFENNLISLKYPGFSYPKESPATSIYIYELLELNDEQVKVKGSSGYKEFEFTYLRNKEEIERNVVVRTEYNEKIINDMARLFYDSEFVLYQGKRKNTQNINDCDFNNLFFPWLVIHFRDLTDIKTDIKEYDYGYAFDKDKYDQILSELLGLEDTYLLWEDMLRKIQAYPQSLKLKKSKEGKDLVVAGGHYLDTGEGESFARLESFEHYKGERYKAKGIVGIDDLGSEKFVAEYEIILLHNPKSRFDAFTIENIKIINK